MRIKRKVFVFGALVFLCSVIVLLSASIEAREEIYEVRPQISVPPYRSDAARAIDAYERMMERFMNITERRLIDVGTSFDEVVKKLDSIDVKLTNLDERMGRIEEALGIEKSEQRQGRQEKGEAKKVPKQAAKMVIKN